MSIRYQRMNEEIKKTLSEILRELKDPRVSPLASIMGVEVTNDLKHAKVKVSVYDKEQEPREQTVAALNKAEGFIAREVGRRMQIRALPKFKFLLDDSIEYSVHISGILRELHKDDPEETAPEE
ncbi:MAG: 30S ribosome-binding factor RbfA [Christensenellaceae bacterium]|nr:30S ribosome-binding factor RbfA [Christensenellaceae bacterium]